MLRYDPTRKDHTKFLNQNFEEKKEVDPIQYNVEEIEVSKETFYKVSDDLAKSLKGNESFSLLNMFGGDAGVENDGGVEKYKEILLTDDKEKQKNLKRTGKGKNPFKYDSSDSENDDLPTAKTSFKTSDKSMLNKKVGKSSKMDLFHESFFFLIDDSRFADGAEMYKPSNDDLGNFHDIHHELKRIVQRKIMKNQTSNQFRKRKLNK